MSFIIWSQIIHCTLSQITSLPLIQILHTTTCMKERNLLHMLINFRTNLMFPFRDIYVQRSLQTSAPHDASWCTLSSQGQPGFLWLDSHNFGLVRKLLSRRICLLKNRMYKMLQSKDTLVCVLLLLIDHHYYILLASQILASQLINNCSNY